MKHIQIIIIMIACVVMPIRVSASNNSQVLMKGQSTTLNFDYEIGDIAVADPGVCDYLVGKDRRSLYLNGRGGGETSVTLWDSGGSKRGEISVRVVTSTLKDALDRANQEFGELSGVKVEVKNGRVEVTGEVAEPEDFRRIEGAGRQDPRIRSRVKIAGDVVSEVAHAIRSAIDVPGVTVRAVRDRVVLEGIAYSQTDAKRAMEIAKLYSPDVLDLIDVRDTKREVGRGRMIELTFHMMEVKKGALRQLGVNWAPGSFPAGGGGSGNGGGGAGLLSEIGGMGRELVGFVLQLVPKLKFLRERGDGRVLENPSVVVKSGEEAKIFSGSEVPYYKGQDVQFKKVGIDIDAVPIETPNGIDIKLTATLSAPTSDLRGAIDTHTISTTAICPPGASMVLGNIVRNGDVKMKNRAPRDIDTSSALFTLFLSKDFQSNRSEFVIFVTPRVVEMPSLAELQLKDFLAMEEAMIKDRSKKELKEFISKRDGDVMEKSSEEETATVKRRKSKGKWR